MTTYPLTGSPTVLDGGASTLIAITNSGVVPVQVQASGPNGRIGRQVLPGASATVPGWRDVRTTVQTAGQAGQVDVTLTAGSPAAGPGPGAVTFSPGAASSMAVTVTGGRWFSDEGLTTAVTWPKTVTTPTTYYPAAPASVRAAMTVGSTTQTRGMNVVDGCAETLRWESSAAADGHLSAQTAEAQTGASAGTSTYADRISSVLGRQTALPPLSQVNAVMASPPTVGTLSTTSIIASGVLVAPVSNSGTGLAILGDRIAFRGAGGITWAGTGFPGTQYVKATSLTTVPANIVPMSADIITDGDVVEIKMNGSGDKFRIRVDGELVSATPITLANDGSFYFQPLTFATRAFRRISVEMGSSHKFAGFQVGPNDTVEKPALRGPRTIVVGDSFTEGTGATGSCMGWVSTFARAMGWDDVWPSGVGSTGYLNPGTGGKVKFRDRLANDVLPWSPQVVVWGGGINDQSNYTAAAIGAEALTCFQTVQAAIAGVIQIVLSPFTGTGVEGFTAALLDTRDALKAAAAAASTTAQPVYFVDLMEMPIDGTVASTTLASGNSVNATSLSLTGFVPKGATIEIDAGSTRERRVISAVSGTGPYTATVAAMTATHSAGAVITQVGPSYLTGKGRVGTTTGSGNADLFTSSDGIHPSQAGHDHIGRIVRTQIARTVLAA